MLENSLNHEIIGQRLTHLRERMIKTQAYMAQELHVSLRQYKKFENGSRSLTIPVLSLLNLKFKVNLNWLLFGFNPQLDFPSNIHPSLKVTSKLKLRPERDTFYSNIELLNLMNIPSIEQAIFEELEIAKQKYNEDKKKSIADGTYKPYDDYMW